ncbi:uncharacterized protein ACB058_016171 [Synchiropus picturatus]
MFGHHRELLRRKVSPEEIQLLVRSGVSPKQQDQEAPVTRVIKEEEEEDGRHEEEQLQVLEEADECKVPFTIVTIKTEDEEDDAQYSQLYSTEERPDPHTCNSTQLKEEDGCDYGQTERNSHLCHPPTDHETTQSSDCETEDSEDWSKSTDPLLDSVMMAKVKHCCTDCGILFRSESHLMDHIRSHTGPKPFSCSVCNKAFSRHNTLLNHMGTHTGEKKYSCSVCERRFTWPTQLTNHQCVDVNNPTVKKGFVCSECGKVYSSQQTLHTHKKIHTGEKPFICSECGKRFGFKGDLTKHLLIHSEPQHVCSVCNKRFTLKVACDRHFRRVHNQEKPFNCSVCDKNFVDHSSLKCHMRTHTGEKPFTCSVCCQSFRIVADLKNHMRKHTGEKPYACSFCQKCFRLRSDLIVHVRIHTGEKPYVCSVCNKAFSASGNLNSHKKKCCDKSV